MERDLGRKQPVYLESGRVACEPIWETEAREARERAQDPIRRSAQTQTLSINKANHLKNLHGEKGVDGLTGYYHGTFFLRGVPRSARFR